MAESTPLQFEVPDMDCQGCVRSITDALKKLDPKAEVVADLETKRLVVGSSMSAAQAAEAIDAAGFEVKAAG
jgi:copper chaperone